MCGKKGTLEDAIYPVVQVARPTNHNPIVHNTQLRVYVQLLLHEIPFLLVHVPIERLVRHLAPWEHRRRRNRIGGVPGLVFMMPRIVH